MKPSERVNRNSCGNNFDAYVSHAIKTILEIMDEQADKVDITPYLICVRCGEKIKTNMAHRCNPNEQAEKDRYIKKPHNLTGKDMNAYEKKSEKDGKTKSYKICDMCYEQVCAEDGHCCKPKDNGEIIKELASEIKEDSYKTINGWQIEGNAMYIAEHLIKLGYRKTGGQS